jgi:hypothetical protein
MKRAQHTAFIRAGLKARRLRRAGGILLADVEEQAEQNKGAGRLYTSAKEDRRCVNAPSFQMAGARLSTEKFAKPRRSRGGRR